jgi:hypothetical protein
MRTPDIGPGKLSAGRASCASQGRCRGNGTYVAGLHADGAKAARVEGTSDITLLRPQVSFRRISRFAGPGPQAVVDLVHGTPGETHRQSQRDVAALTAALLWKSICGRACTRARGGRRPGGCCGTGSRRDAGSGGGRRGLYGECRLGGCRLSERWRRKGEGGRKG